MMRAFRATMVLVMLVSTVAVAAPDADLGPWTAAEKQVIVGGSTLDGRTIVDLQTAGACRTRFLVSDGDVVIDWSNVTNLLPHVVGQGEEIEIVRPGSHPMIFVPDENRGTLAFSGFVGVRDCLHAAS